ncbi:MAG: FeoB small GTPase domain-containing protein [Gemmataceae bacterium]
MTVPTASPAKPLVVALLGNPNTGKTTLFNALSGLNHRVGNYPGVTVESRKGRMTCDGVPFEIVDLPGTYSLAPRSPDEMVTVDVILGRQAGEARPDVVVCLADASNLERNLYLTTQALSLGAPVVVALNMIDVAEGQGIRIDAALLTTCWACRSCRSRRTARPGRLGKCDRLRLRRRAPPRALDFPEPFRREVDQATSKDRGRTAEYPRPPPADRRGRLHRASA